MKLFFENEEPGHYAEVFVNVIAPEQRIELHEKDPEYRMPQLRALDAGGLTSRCRCNVKFKSLKSFHPIASFPSYRNPSDFPE